MLALLYTDNSTFVIAERFLETTILELLRWMQPYLRNGSLDPSDLGTV